MKGLGITLAAIGAAIIFYAYVAMDTSASTYLPAIGPLGIGGQRDIVNLALMQDRLLTFIGGCTLLIAGSIVTSVGALADRAAAPAPVAHTISTTDAPTLQEPRQSLGERYVAEQTAGSEMAEVVKVIGIGIAMVLVIVLLVKIFASEPPTSQGNAIDLSENMTAAPSGATP